MVSIHKSSYIYLPIIKDFVLFYFSFCLFIHLVTRNNGGKDEVWRVKFIDFRKKDLVSHIRNFGVISIDINVCIGGGRTYIYIYITETKSVRINVII